MNARLLRLGASVRRYLMAENWTWDEPEAAARRRASWPAWRRAVRPVGVAAYLTGIIGQLLFEPKHRDILAGDGFFLVVALIVVSCVVFGTVDGIRWRRADRRAATNSPATGHGAS